MILRSKRHLRKRTLLTLAVTLVLTVLALTYCLFLFLNYEEVPLAEDAVEKMLERLMEGQILPRMDLKLKVDPGEAGLSGEARVTFDLPQRGRRLILPNVLHLLFFLHPDLVFFLHPDLEIDRIVWGDRELKFRRVKSMVFVDLEAQIPDDGIVILDVTYHGRLIRREGNTILSPDLVYLDPRDQYYPSQDYGRTQVHVELDLPEGLLTVAPPAGQSVSALALAGYPMQAVTYGFGDLNFHFYGWEEKEDWLLRELSAIGRFLAERLPPPQLHEFRIMRSPSMLQVGIQYDDVGTMLLPSGVGAEEVAFLFSLFWLQTQHPEAPTLITREEIARGLALYYIHLCEGDVAYRIRLHGLSERRTPETLSLGESLIGDPNGRGSRPDTSHGAYMLSMLRRIIGDAAFDRILAIVLDGMNRGISTDWTAWNNHVIRNTGEDLRWFFKRWVRDRRSLNLAIDDFKVVPHTVGQRITLTLQNRGNLKLPEKVRVLFITANGAVEESMTISTDSKTVTRFVQERVVGVVVDPDGDWYDVDRTDNIAYLEPFADLVIPSRDNSSLAVAYRKRAGSDRYPLVIFSTGGEITQVFSLAFPVEGMEWISDHRLLVTVRCRELPDRQGSAPKAHYFLDTLLGKLEFFKPGIDILASDSGRYLLLNFMKDRRWQHKLKDLDKKLTRGILSGISQNVPYRLQWLPGTDSVIPVYPFDFQGKCAIYLPDGEEKNWFLIGDERIHGMHGFGEGLVFLREKAGRKGFFTKTGTDQIARLKANISGEPRGFAVSEYGGNLLWREEHINDRIRILSFDATSGKKDVLYQGLSEGIYDIFCDKGVLMQRTRIDGEGRSCQDILFHRFGEQEGEFITDSPAPERILALVGNQRYLYYAEVIQPHWSSLDVYNCYRFYCYDFLNRENLSLDFSAWSP
ncbi:MAG: M1 aminopeptidase family protein [Planctomycetota bacterium]|jgi:hypothetical protein